MAWLSGWTYRRSITINNSSNSNTLTDYQVLITLDTQSLISAGKMRSDGGDIRFTDSDGSTQLNYWIESGINTTSTRIWVKVPSIPASSTKTIYVYYGNPSATSVSNGKATFVVYDDFNDNSIDTNIWTVGTYYGPTPVETNTEIQVSGTTSGGGYWRSHSYLRALLGSGSIGYEVVVTALANLSSTPGAHAEAILAIYISDTQLACVGAYTENNTFEAWTTDGLNFWSTGGRDSKDAGGISQGGSYANNTYRTIKILWWNGTFTFYYDNTNQITTRSKAWGSNTFYLLLDVAVRTSDTASVLRGKFDNVQARKYTSPEPTTSIGSEEQYTITGSRRLLIAQ